MLLAVTELSVPLNNDGLIEGCHVDFFKWMSKCYQSCNFTTSIRVDCGELIVTIISAIVCVKGLKIDRNFSSGSPLPPLSCYAWWQYVHLW